MAMINDKGPEESRDTDATYIILSHQSVHLPGPTRQKRMGLGEKEEVEVKETKKKKKRREKKGSRLSTPSLLHAQGLLLFFFREK